MFSPDDTICAIASAPGGAARGIVRLAGPRVAEVVANCFTPPIQTKMAIVTSGKLQVGEPIGELPGDLFFWPNERSYTRQPTAEFHTIGSPPMLAAVVRAFSRQDVRLAEPGEFTLRAFLGGRLDLAQAEAVLGVIDATTQQQLDVALTQLAGGISRPLFELRERLLESLAQLEAGLDFVEEDIDFISTEELDHTLADAETRVADLIAQLRLRTDAVELPIVMLTGQPNVGKSSLFNALAGRSAAIVSHHPGTTRDYLTAVLRLDRVKCELVDTAGMECADPSNLLDQSVQSAANDVRKRAKVVLVCIDSTRPLTDFEKDWLNAVHQGHASMLYVLTKCDQPRNTDFHRVAIETSSENAHGLADLVATIDGSLAEVEGDTAVVGTAERCHDCLRAAASSLARARQLNCQCAGEELIAAELRSALAELGKVVGTVYTDDILDRIFSRFCIGK